MIGFPLLLIPLAIYNIIAFLMRDVKFDAQLVTVPMISGASWTVTLSDALLAFGLFLLLLEIIKGARPLGKYVTDHLLALLIFVGAAAEFVMLPPFATSTFFLLTMLALVDFLSGLSLRARRPRRTREIVTPVATQDDDVREHEPQLSPTAITEVSRTMEAHRIRTEPIIESGANIGDVERDRRVEDVVVPVRVPPVA